jgi:hypothetical protein
LGWFVNEVPAGCLAEMLENGLQGELRSHQLDYR